MTEETLKYLGNDYEVIPGEGGKRNVYLRENNITTYFIKADSYREKVSFCFFLSLIKKIFRLTLIL